jgi:FMN phosphatase YigB (HAD superfamily)
VNVLIVSGGGFQGFSLFRALEQDPGVSVVVADIYEHNVTQFFAHGARCVPLLDDEPAFKSALRSVCVEESIDVVFPATQRELPILAALRGSGELGAVAIAAPSAGLLARILNKRDLYEWLVQHDVPCLETWSAEEGAEREVAFPLFAKPALGWGSSDTRVVRTPEQLGELAPHAMKYVLQRYLSDPEEFSVDFAIDFRGELSPLFIRRRVRVSLGFAVIADSVEHPEVEASIRRLGQALAAEDGRGVFNVQVLISEGRHFVSDVNPRFGTSAGFSLGLGISLPLFVCASLAENVCAVRRTEHHARATRMVRSLVDLHIPYIPALRDCSAVVFDLDDTLLDQKAWIAHKLALLFAKLAHRLPVDRGAFMRAGWWALERGEQAKLIDAVMSDLRLAHGLRDELIETYREVAPATFQPYGDVRSVLLALRAKGIRAGILTDNPVRSQQQKLSASGLLRYIDCVVFSREHGSEKPAESAFNAICANLKVEPTRACMVGNDLFRDVAGALDAGFGHAFLIQRAGSLANPAPALARELIGGEFEKMRFSVISGLREVVHALTFATQDTLVTHSGFAVGGDHCPS